VSSRGERKRHARAEREAREREAAANEQRVRRLRLLAALLVAAVAVVAVLVVVSQSGEDEPGGGLGGGESLSGAGAANALFEGIPQTGARLGDPEAPVRLLEFVDLQCPFCAQYTERVLPTIVDRYVRTGEIQVELRPLAFLGDDSVRGAAAASAAADQNRMWQFTDIFYRNQGAENSGYVTDEFLRRVARASGVDPAPIVAAADGGRVSPLLRGAQRQADRYGVNSTPSFLIGPAGGELQPLQVGELTPEAFTGQLDQVVQGG
jgi:protein-disulfide isomerase